MSVKVAITPGFTSGVPRELFTGSYAVNQPARAYDVSPSGHHFLLLQSSEPQPERITQMHVVQNWTGELERLVPRR
jgi:hypothetical protein